MNIKRLAVGLAIGLATVTGYADSTDLRNLVEVLESPMLMVLGR